MKVKDITAAIDELAPPGWAFPEDPIGLAIGDPEMTVKAVLIALTVTRQAFDTAQQAGAQLIVSHHPLLWEPLTALRTDHPATRLCLDLAATNMACFSAHSNLDVAPKGVNGCLADQLKLNSTIPLIPAPHVKMVKLVTFVPESHLAGVREAVCAAGAGVIGDYTHCSFSTPGVGTFRPGARTTPFSGKKGQLNEEPEWRFEVLVPLARLTRVLGALHETHPYEEPAFDILGVENIDKNVGLGRIGELSSDMTLRRFADTVRKQLDIPHVRVVGDLDSRTRVVAVMGGAGGKYVDELPSYVDVFVTGDVGYHDARTALDRNIAVIDAGHAALEKWGAAAIAGHLRHTFKKLPITLLDEYEMFQPIP
jgi:dinuclear metal center YbgI/SA1388 family protein